MSGGKGHSGRKGFYHELDMKSLLNKSYSIQMAYFDDPNIDKEKKAEFACRYLQKRVGEKIDIAVEHVLSYAQLEQLASQIKERINVNIIDVEASTSP